VALLGVVIFLTEYHVWRCSYRRRPRHSPANHRQAQVSAKLRQRLGALDV